MYAKVHTQGDIINVYDLNHNNIKHNLIISNVCKNKMQQKIPTRFSEIFISKSRRKKN